MKIHIEPISEKTSMGRMYGLFAEDGELLYTHFCSNDTYAPGDLILDRPERIEELNKRFGSVELIVELKAGENDWFCADGKPKEDEQE